MNPAPNPAGNTPPLYGLLAEDFLNKTMPTKEPLVEGLLHQRDLVALGARRRNGKTSFVTDLAVNLALGPGEFLGYNIPAARRTLLVNLEDDPGEYQEKLRRVVGGRDLGGRLRLLTREDFLAAKVPITVLDAQFCKVVSDAARGHVPDLVVLDNLAQLVGADYNDAPKVHKVACFCYDLGRATDAAIIVPAHPKKEDATHPIDLVANPTAFFESIMGSSHFINSMGSLWGLQRDGDTTAFLGGRQRGDGQQAASYLELEDAGHFYVVSDFARNAALATGTEKRARAWALLPDPPATFGYREAQDLVKAALHSSASFTEWMKECRRLGVVLDARDGKLIKAGAVAAQPLGFRGRQ